MKNTTTRKPSNDAGAGPVPGIAPRRGPVAAPSPEDVARRAYEIFLARGNRHGDSLADWLQAEQELLQRRPRES